MGNQRRRWVRGLVAAGVGIAGLFALQVPATVVGAAKPSPSRGALVVGHYAGTSGSRPALTRGPASKYGALVATASGLALAQFNPDGTGLTTGPGFRFGGYDDAAFVFDGKRYVAVVKYGLALYSVPVDPSSGAFGPLQALDGNGYAGFATASLGDGRALVVELDTPGAGVGGVRAKLLTDGAAPPAWTPIAGVASYNGSRGDTVAAAKDRYLVVWRNDVGFTGAFVTADGVPGAPFAITTTTTPLDGPVLAWDASSATFTLAWAERAPDNRSAIRSLHLDAAGRAVDAAPALIGTAVNTNQPRIAADGRVAVFTWVDFVDDARSPTGVTGYVRRATQGFAPNAVGSPVTTEATVGSPVVGVTAGFSPGASALAFVQVVDGWPSLAVKPTG